MQYTHVCVSSLLRGSAIFQRVPWSSGSWTASAPTIKHTAFVLELKNFQLTADREDKDDYTQ